MNRKVVVANLIKCANELDKNKLYKEANELTGIVKRLAQVGDLYQTYSKAARPLEDMLEFANIKNMDEQELNETRDALMDELDRREAYPNERLEHIIRYIDTKSLKDMGPQGRKDYESMFETPTEAEERRISRENSSNDFGESRNWK